MLNILVVDDNESIRKLTTTYLSREGYHVITASDGVEALAVVEQERIDLMIADIMMPNMDGYTLTSELRSYKPDLPILMITAKESYEDKKRGFMAGSDDYMVKPIDFDEMLLRVAALLRRAKISNEHKIVVGDITLNYENLTISSPDTEMQLPKKEFYLLFKLLSYPQKIFTRQDLMDEIWGMDNETDERTVDVHIRRLREKLQHIQEFEIVTVRGLGYKVDKHI